MKGVSPWLMAALLLAGCNTIQGAGRDIKSVGQAIDKSAGAAKDDGGRNDGGGN
jgi:predicted small secreted protein